MANIKIYDSHIPALKAADYDVTVSQNLNVLGKNLDASLSKPFKFEVAGEKYSLNQQQVQSVFPPKGSLGDFSLFYSQIILNRNTLPWEREAKEGDEDTPWLALIIFDEDDLINTGSSKIFTPHIKKKDWEGDTRSIIYKEVAVSKKKTKEDLMSIVVSSQNIIADLLPEFDELPYLAHIRKANKEPEKAVIVCNRLPTIGKKHYVHLVSLENRFDTSGFIHKPDKNGNDALVSLMHWEFFCNDHFVISKEALDVYKDSLKKDSTDTDALASDPLKNALSDIQEEVFFNRDDLASKLSLAFTDPDNLTDLEKEQLGYVLKTFRIGHLPDILKHLNRTPGTLRVKDDFYKNANNKKHAKQGYINIPYVLKTGKEIKCFYRGPLVPISNLALIDSNIPIRHADQAFQYLSDANKLDVSYASAWELGRLLILQNKNVSTALYKWKRNCYHIFKQGGKALLVDNYPSPPELVINWFKDIKALKGIPFNYLVPEPAAMPFESIRFFTIDPNWLRYFIDGAFSLGRISSFEVDYDSRIYDFQSAHEANEAKFNFLLPPQEKQSGFLLHSVAVAGWPDMHIYGNDDEKHVPFRRESLSPNSLICLFNGGLNSVSLHQKPVSIHFGVEDDDQADTYHRIIDKIKALKYPLPMDRSLITNDTSPVTSFINDLVQQIEVIKFETIIVSD